MTSNEEPILNKDKTNTIPLYKVAEHQIEEGGVYMPIFELKLEGCIYEKMFLLFEKLQPVQNQLEDAKIDVEIKKHKLLLETDFSKALGKTRTNKEEREAYIKPLLADEENLVDELENLKVFYTNKINILNDLINMKRTLLKIEGDLI
ncbi:hypothetical protein [Methanobrevibacter sp.]